MSHQTSLNAMNREEWLEWRRQGIGSSDAASIMGVSPWATPFQTWKDKVFGSTKEDNWAMKRGRDTEEEARQWFTKQTGLDVKPCNVVNSVHSWLRASFDGLTECRSYAVEIKVPGKKDHSTASMQKIPVKYVPQIQHQFLVEPKIIIDFYVSYNWAKRDGIIIEQARDNAYIDELLFPKEQWFWDLVLTKTPPPLTSRDHEDIENLLLINGSKLEYG